MRLCSNAPDMFFDLCFMLACFSDGGCCDFRGRRLAEQKFRLTHLDPLLLFDYILMLWICLDMFSDLCFMLGMLFRWWLL
jgi:hypothetical protein